MPSGALFSDSFSHTESLITTASFLSAKSGYFYAHFSVRKICVISTPCIIASLVSFIPSKRKVLIFSRCFLSFSFAVSITRLLFLLVIISKILTPFFEKITSDFRLCCFLLTKKHITDCSTKTRENPGFCSNRTYLSASLAFSTIAANASLSDTAISASIFLLRLMPANLRPCISCE